jgi:sortase A
VYEVHKIRIVNSDDKTVIVPTEDAVLTLSTCYPFRFIGNAPKRYIVQAGLIIGGPVA